MTKEFQMDGDLATKSWQFQAMKMAQAKKVAQTMKMVRPQRRSAGEDEEIVRWRQGKEKDNNDPRS